jgi:carotenoid 1,2-hydratase
VFSPYYAWAGRGEPENHICLNVALYGPRAKRWTMTERGARSLSRDADHFRIGPSRLDWKGDALEIAIDEIATPHLTRVRGRIRVIPQTVNRTAFALDGARRHWWRPIAPSARIEVAMDSPAQSWSGAGYLDMNAGAEPLEEGFARWDWSRASLGCGRSAILYDVAARDGGGPSLALRFGADGTPQDMPAPPRQRLPGTLWRVPRMVQADADATPKEVRRLEDSPFYSRAELRSRLWGETAHAVHETVDGDRFAKGWVKMLLPWRMPRIVI